jgi:hypothetical protein
MVTRKEAMWKACFRLTSLRQRQQEQKPWNAGWAQNPHQQEQWLADTIVIGGSQGMLKLVI